MQAPQQSLEQLQPVIELEDPFSDGSSVVSIGGLRHFFGEGTLRKAVLSDINLQIREGEIVILTGPSGSGKTTLLTLIGGLRSACEGNLEVLGNQLVGADIGQLVNLRRQIGFVFQAHNLLKFLSVGQNVAMSAELKDRLSDSEVRRRVSEVVSAVGLADHTNKFPDQLSGGQKQRVAIARALVNEPRLILADEPTAALDSKSGRDVVNLLNDLAKRKGSTILLVTHDNRILDIADRIVRMEDGVLVPSD